MQLPSGNLVWSHNLGVLQAIVIVEFSRRDFVNAEREIVPFVL